MQMTPEWPLMMLAVVLVMGASQWRRRRLTRAARDLPTRLRRMLGAEPDYDLPEDLPEGLQTFAKLQRRTLRVQNTVWGLAILWLGWVVLTGMGILG
jgi:hypothetical protein